MKFALWNEKTASTGLLGAIDEAILQRRHRQRRIVRIPGYEGAPSGEIHVQRDLRVAETHPREGKARLEPRLLEARQSVAPGGCAASRADDDRFSPGKQRLASGNRSLQDAGEIPPLALDAERGKAERFVEHLGVMAQREVREAPATLEAHHARADSPHREGDPVQVLPGIGLIEIPHDVHGAPAVEITSIGSHRREEV